VGPRRDRGCERGPDPRPARPARPIRHTGTGARYRARDHRFADGRAARRHSDRERDLSRRLCTERRACDRIPSAPHAPGVHRRRRSSPDLRRSRPRSPQRPRSGPRPRHQGARHSSWALPVAVDRRRRPRASHQPGRERRLRALLRDGPRHDPRSLRRRRDRAHQLLHRRALHPGRRGPCRVARLRGAENKDRRRLRSDLDRRLSERPAELGRRHGFKLSATATNTDTPPITAVDVAPASEQDGPQAKHLIDAQPAGRRPQRLLGDTAYGTGPIRAELAEREVDVLAPVPEAPAKPGRLAKRDFHIDLQAGTVTCPAGQVAPIRTEPSGARRATFSKRACDGCPPGALHDRARRPAGSHCPRRTPVDRRPSSARRPADGRAPAPHPAADRAAARLARRPLRRPQKPL